MTLKNELKLYEMINKHSGVTIFKFARLLNWNYKKTKKYIYRLLIDQLITQQLFFGTKIYRPTSLTNFINWSEMKMTKKVQKK